MDKDILKSTLKPLIKSFFGGIRAWMSNFSTEILRIIFALLSAIIALAWQYAQNNIEFIKIMTSGSSKELNTLIVYIAALSFTMTTAGALTKNVYLKKIEDLKGDIAAAVPSDSRVVLRGKTEDTLNYLKKRLSKAKQVNNTVISVSNKRKRFDNYLSDENKREMIADIIKGVIKRGGRWRDIVSQDALNRVESVRLRLDDEAQHDYDASKLKHEIPILNFIIIEFTDRKKEVMFGFGLHENDMNGCVFSTSDQDIVDAYGRYFESLLKYCDEI